MAQKEPGEARLLSGLRVIECSMLGPAAVSTPLADLGAEVIKVETPSGDYVRHMSWPMVEGTSLLHLHVNRGKRSIVLDLTNAQARATFLELVAVSDAVVEAMRPGALARRGLGFEQLRAVNPKIVMLTISGYGMTGPYRSLPSHGIAYDAWAGTVAPVPGVEGMPSIPDHTSIGINAGPLYGTAALLAGVLHARQTGEGCYLEVAQSDAAAAFDWLRSETHQAYQRPESEVTGNPTDGFERRPPGTGGMADGVRYQFYRSSDGYILFMASERKFWQNFCAAVGRDDLFEAKPGEALADHAKGDVVLRRELAVIFEGRTTAEWVELGLAHDVPIGPVNTPETVSQDPQFVDRMPWQSSAGLVADQLPFPVRIAGHEPQAAAVRAPEPGEHDVAVLSDILGYDAARIAQLRGCGALGSDGAAASEHQRGTSSAASQGDHGSGAR